MSLRVCNKAINGHFSRAVQCDTGSASVYACSSDIGKCYVLIGGTFYSQHMCVRYLPIVDTKILDSYSGQIPRVSLGDANIVEN